jgi:hypothetical protein
MKIKIDVTQREIDDANSYWGKITGQVPGCDHCPVALAIRRQTEDKYASVSSTINYMDRKYAMPEAVTEFVVNFDNRLGVSPFSFELDTSNPIN